MKRLFLLGCVESLRNELLLNQLEVFSTTYTRVQVREKGRGKEEEEVGRGKGGDKGWRFWAVFSHPSFLTPVKYLMFRLFCVLSRDILRRLLKRAGAEMYMA